MKTICSTLSYIFLIVTLQSCKNTKKIENTFVDSRDNMEYTIIKVGSQLWFAENFAYLPMIDTSKVSVYGYKGTSIDEAKATASYKTYGALYSWEYAKKLAPNGWRLPTDNDWKNLEFEIGLSQETINIVGWRGENNEVKHLKNNGKTGFNILFGGWRTDYGVFQFQKQHANFWCADEFDEERAFERLIGSNNQRIGREYGNKGCGFSVRYVKDITE